jgi:hypothetical protein
MRIRFYILIGSCLLALPIIANKPEPTYLAEPAPRIIHRAHLYHGIQFSTLNHETGERYFYRDGKKCQLLTEAFLRSEGKP